MAEVDFSDLDSAKAWFEGQSVEVRCAMASRAALRVLANIGLFDRDDLAGVALPVMRAILLSAGRGLVLPAEKRDFDWDSAADSAYSAAEFAAYSAAYSAADSAAYSAADSVRAAADAAAYSAFSARSADAAFSAYSAAYSAADSAAYSAIGWDSQRSPAALFSQKVWAGAEVPNAIAENHQRFLTFLRADPAWAFWLRFYEGMWEGTFDEWDLAFEVIQIDEADWKKGYARIGEVIAGIEAGILAARTNLAEEIILDPETELFKAIPIPVENPALIQAVIERVNDNLTDALLGRNGLREDESFVRKLRRANTRYLNDPQRLELDYTSAAVSIRRLIDSKELDDAEDNLTLLESVEDGTRALRANHPEIAANREQLAKQNLRQLSADDIELLQDAQTLLPKISADIISEDFAIDIPQLINDATLPLPSGAPPLPGADETTRIFYRVSRMKQIVDGISDKGAAVFDSKGFKTVRFGLTVSGLLGSLVSLGLWIVGVI